LVIWKHGGVGNRTGGEESVPGSIEGPQGEWWCKWIVDDIDSQPGDVATGLSAVTGGKRWVIALADRKRVGREEWTSSSRFAGTVHLSCVCSRMTFPPV